MKKNAGRIWIIAEAAIAVLLIGAIVVKSVFADNVSDEPTYSIPAKTAAEVPTEDIPRPADLLEDEETEEAENSVSENENKYVMDYPGDVLNKLTEMTTEQKISMLIVTSPETICDVERVKTAGDVFQSSYESRPVTGLIFSDENYESENEGMNMLKTLREWSREVTGMNLLLGYREQDDGDAGSISDRGYNLYLIPSGTENAAELAAEVMDRNMVPALTMSLEEATEQEDGNDALIIAQMNDAASAINAINEGRRLLYSTDDMEMISALEDAVNNGEISAEALDHAAGYGVSIRQALTENRPEEYEKEPVEETPEDDSSKKQPAPQAEKTVKTEKTPEQLAAEEAQKQAEALAKQIEEAQKKTAEQNNTAEQSNTADQSNTAAKSNTSEQNNTAAQSNTQGQ